MLYPKSTLEDDTKDTLLQYLCSRGENGYFAGLYLSRIQASSHDLGFI